MSRGGRSTQGREKAAGFLPGLHPVPESPGCPRRPGARGTEQIQQHRTQRAWSRAVWRTPISVQQGGPVGEVRGWGVDGLCVKASGVLRKSGGGGGKGAGRMQNPEDRE